MGILDGSEPEPPETMEVVKAADKKEIVLTQPWFVGRQGSTCTELFVEFPYKGRPSPVATVTKSAQAWEALESIFSAHSKARVANLRMQLATLKEGSMSCSTF